MLRLEFDSGTDRETSLSLIFFSLTMDFFPLDLPVIKKRNRTSPDAIHGSEERWGVCPEDIEYRVINNAFSRERVKRGFYWMWDVGELVEMEGGREKR